MYEQYNGWLSFGGSAALLALGWEAKKDKFNEGGSASAVWCGTFSSVLVSVVGHDHSVEIVYGFYSHRHKDENLSELFITAYHKSESVSWQKFTFTWCIYTLAF